VAYDEQLADRVRDTLSARSDVAEKRMFGGIAFMVEGKMAVGVLGEDLIVRLGHDDTAKALGEDGVRAFDFTGRASKTMVYVGPERTADDRALGEWIEAGAAYAASLAAS
jgi:TfoX/Sxy family transcriptional regulator of competence genes